jgi:hypothetical protein
MFSVPNTKDNVQPVPNYPLHSMSVPGGSSKLSKPPAFLSSKLNK